MDTAEVYAARQSRAENSFRIQPPPNRIANTQVFKRSRRYNGEVAGVKGVRGFRYVCCRIHVVILSILHPQECPIELATIRESIHPEDREFVFRKAAEAVQGEVRVDAEHRIVRPNGEVRVVHSQGDLKRDAAGRPWQMFGTVQDTTDRKLAEDKIREQEAGLRQMLDLAPQHIGVYGPNRERLYLNRISLNYFGISLEEWRQSPRSPWPGPGDYVHPDDSGRWGGVFGHVVSRGSADEVELRLRRRDGTYRWFLARFNPLRDEHGQIMRWYVAATDIEDRKQAEDRLRSENVALREEIDKASMFEEIVGTSPALKRVSRAPPKSHRVILRSSSRVKREQARN